MIGDKPCRYCEHMCSAHKQDKTGRCLGTDERGRPCPCNFFGEEGSRLVVGGKVVRE